MAKNKFYVTTAIDYVNAPYPHIGHAYQKIIADALARWHRLIGDDTLFVTGTDEHGKKIAQSAEVEGKTPRIFVDEKAKQFQESWDLLNISYDRFIRTTDKDHELVVNDVLKRIWDAGDIYKGFYEGLYCVGCEAYYTDKNLINGECGFHPGQKLETLKEETYFFRLSKYQKFLLEHIKKNTDFILPDSRRNEIINRLKEDLKDLSITRTSINWGIPFIFDKKHVLYVWAEALINYYSAAQTKGKKWEKFWPANLHLLGVDNSWFHTVIWPAMLKSAGLKIPRTVFIHGFLTFNGQKISKSLGNAIAIPILTKKYSADTLRYFVCRQFPLASGADGDFSESALVSRHNTELADKLGNLVSRVSALAEKHGLENVKKPSLEFDDLDNIKKLFDNYELDKVLNEIFSYIDKCNQYIQEKKPWESPDNCRKVLYDLVLAIKNIAILLSPFIPKTSEKIAKHFGFVINLKEINKTYKIQKIKKSDILFKKIELKGEVQPNINKSSNVGIINMSDLKFSDWEKIDLRVGRIIDVEDLKESDKLYKMQVELGSKDRRTVVAGIKKHYSAKELKGKKFIFLTNLEPRKIMDIKSEAMILAASSKDKLSLIAPEKDVDAGSKLS